MSFSVQEVAQLLKQAKDNKKPYVFFTGAGCSRSAGVPTAIELISEIKEKFPIQIKNINSENEKYNSALYMSALDKHERRQLLEPYIIKNQKINWAHLALACLMQEGYVQRVLTFNFDSILSRACSFLGLHPSIYDFATANPHLYHLINDPSIVHLHGQGTGFIQLNTKEETQDHTELLGDFIAATLNTNPSLFIGYSGNADEFFPLLKAKYSEQHRLIWTGRKENIDDIEADSVKDFLKENSNLTHYIGNIDADHFLIQLAKELKCFPPKLFLNPYTFLTAQLSQVQPYPLGDNLDILQNLREHLIERGSKSLITSLYTVFIHKFPSKESTSGLNPKMIDEIVWAYDQQARDLYSENKIKECFALYECALKINNQNWVCLNNYAIRLIAYSQKTQNKEHLDKALNLLKIALKIDPDRTFTLAVHHCIKGDKYKTNQNLMRASNKYSYPSLEEFENIFNSNNYHDTEWYQYIIQELKQHDYLPF
ncbi:MULTISPECIES: SIR2 family protein [Acinetobacter]|uniref:SIR2 family protein n=2 Tax=Moraxellaceae TaxID=468 RepID=UPI00257D4B73|nr:MULTISPECIES: SIR2 family protein [Acinetobacter]